MGNKKSPARNVWVIPRFRIMAGTEIALGPGRVELLELVGQTGSLRKAAQQMGISYMRAWQMIGYTNRCFSKPVVKAVRGGKSGGGASLTAFGKEVIALYRRMEQKSQRAVQEPWRNLRNFVKKGKRS
jgi:molybdate transport system regulatory protein